MAAVPVTCGHGVVTLPSQNPHRSVGFSSHVVCGSIPSPVCTPWSSLAVRRCNEGLSRNRFRQWRPLFVAHRTAQAAPKEAEEEVEVEEEEVQERDNNSNGVPQSALVQGFKEALAAEDETLVKNFEGRLRAIEDSNEALTKQVSILSEEVQTGKERLLRLNADFDNFRKRTDGEKLALSTNVKGDVVESLLPMVDNFERAKASIKTETEGEEKIDRSYQGIYKQFVEVLKNLGVVAVETVGKAFNPELHEAIMREESSEYDEGIVIQEFRRGFSIGRKLLRPAMVKVSGGPGPNSAPAEEVEEDADLASSSGE